MTDDYQFTTNVQLANEVERLQKFNEMVLEVMRAIAGFRGDAKALPGIATRLCGALLPGATNDPMLLRRMLQNFEVVAECRVCSINLYDEAGKPKPSRKTLPCGVCGCPFEREVMRR